MSVLAVANAAGGVGKTTTATTLGVGLARKLQGNGRVLIVDLDPQGDSASTMLGLRPHGRCVSKVLDGKSYVSDGRADLKAAYRANIMSADRSDDGGPSRPGLWVLPSSDRLKKAKTDMVKEVADRLSEIVSAGSISSDDIPTVPKLFVERLAPLRRLFDVIILDCPPSSDAFEEAIFAFADAVIAPTMLDYKSVRATLLLTRRILDAQKAGHNCRVAYMVPTMVDMRLKLSQSMLENLNGRGYGAMLTEAIPRTVSVAEGPASKGLTILEYIETPQGAISTTAPAAAVAYQELIDRVFVDFVGEKEPAHV